MKSPLRLAAALLFALVLGSCASSPQAKAPEWTLRTPQPDGTNTWFVGYASNPGGDQVAATESAVTNLVAEIMKYLGVAISSESTATAKATLDSYTAEVRTQVKAQSTGRLAGFAVKDKYIWRDPRTGQVFVYVLASYVSSDLEKEKRRVAAAFQEKDDAVSRPAAEARAFLEAGRAWEALGRFVEAALAASGSDVDNADLKIADNLNGARAALGSLRLESLGESYRGLVGQAFAQPFRARLVAGQAGRGVAAAPLLVSWQRRSGTRLVTRTESVSTDKDGLVAYTPPPPDFVGKASFVVALDTAPILTLLDKIPAKYAAQRTALADSLGQKYLDIPYEVVSAARQKPTALAIADLEEGGKPLAQASTQAGLAEALSKEGFVLPALALDPGLLASGPEEAVLVQARAALGSRAERLVLGKATIASVRKDGTVFLAQARAELRVLELSSGRLILAVTGEALGMGQDEASARSAAYRELGAKALAASLLSSLP